MEEKQNNREIPENVRNAIRETIIQSTAAAFQDPAVRARFQEWKKEKSTAPRGNE